MAEVRGVWSKGLSVVGRLEESGRGRLRASSRGRGRQMATESRGVSSVQPKRLITIARPTSEARGRGHEVADVGGGVV